VSEEARRHRIEAKLIEELKRRWLDLEWQKKARKRSSLVNGAAG